VRRPVFRLKKENLVERLMNYLGIAGVAGGFCLITVQGINYLMRGTWVAHTVYGAAENMGLGDMLASHPDLIDYMDKCPLSLTIIIMGFILIWISSGLRSA
jgi:hypothetical protein